MKKYLVVGLFLCLFILPGFGKETIKLSSIQQTYVLGDSLEYEVKLKSDEKTTSKVVYIELVAPEGCIVERKIAKLEGNETAGKIYLAPQNYSGLFELRAYTRYMIAENKDNYVSKAFVAYEWCENWRTRQTLWTSVCHANLKQLTHDT